MYLLTASENEETGILKTGGFACQSQNPSGSVGWRRDVVALTKVSSQMAELVESSSKN